MKTLRIKIQKSGAGRWYWTIVAANGYEVARSLVGQQEARKARQTAVSVLEKIGGKAAVKRIPIIEEDTP